MESIPRRRRRKGAWYATLMALLFTTVFIFVTAKFISQVKTASPAELREVSREVAT